MASQQDGTLSWQRVCYVVVADGDRWFAARAQRARSGVSLQPLARPEEAAAAAARERAPVVSCLGARDAIARWIEAPFLSPRKSRRVYATLLDIQLPFPLEECVHTLAAEERTPEGRCRALAAGARREQLQAHLRALTGLGLDPWAVDHEGLALWSQAQEELPPADPAAWRVVACLGAATVLAIGQGPRFTGAHRLAADDPGTVRRLLASAGADPESAAIEWIWVGPAAADTSRQDLLRGTAAAAAGHTVKDPAHFLPRAIATRALQAGAWRCNLRLPPFAHPALLARRNRQRLIAQIALLAAGLILVLANWGAGRVLDLRLMDADRRVAAMASELAGYPVKARGADAQRVVEEAVSARRAALAPFHDAKAPSQRLLLFELLRAAGAADLNLENILLADAQVELAGTAPDEARAQSAAAVFETAGRPVRLTREPGGGGAERVAFRIRSEAP